MNRDVQKRVFTQQLELTVALGAPVVFHLREAERDAHDIIRRCVPRGHIMLNASSLRNRRPGDSNLDWRRYSLLCTVFSRKEHRGGGQRSAAKLCRR